MKQLLWLTQIIALMLLSFPFAVIPHAVALKTGEYLGLLVFYLWRSKRRIAIENIEKTVVSDQWTAVNIAKESFKNMGRSFVEVIKIYFGLSKGIIEKVEIKGVENYLKAKSKNKGVVFITGHCGNWELLAISFSIKFDRLYVVARAQNNPYLNAIIEKTRTRYGNSVIYKKGALKSILFKLKKNENVGILMDQSVLKNEGYVIDFLGRPAWTTKMPALIARRSGAAVLPAFIHRNGDRHVITIYPEIELSVNEDAEKSIVEDTKRFSSYIEDYIKQHPSEWLWIHRRWKRT